MRIKTQGFSLKAVILVACAASTLSACSAVEPRHRGDVYGANSVHHAQKVQYAQIVDIQDAYIQSENGNALVAIGGAIAGGYAGKHIGKGSGQKIAQVFGALVGGYGSNELYRQYGSTGKIKQITFQYVRNNDVYTVLQSDPNNDFHVGQTVKVIGSGRDVRILK